MSAPPRFRSLFLLVPACVLVACGSGHRSVLLPSPEELPTLALVIQEGTDGQVVHAWRPAAEFQDALRRLPSSDRGSAPSRPIVLASNRRRDCDQELINCHRNCMRRKLPAPHNYIPRGHPRHDQICRDNCRPPYEDCVEAENARAPRIPAENGAVEWLREHRTELLVGTVVVIAGVAFVVVSAGAGLLVLAPLALMASTGSTDAALCGERAHES